MSGPTASDDGRAAFVTGAGSGIGRATAHELARRGYRLVLLDRDAGAVQATADAIAGCGGAARAVAGDVTSEDDQRAAVQTCLDAFGGLDAAVACAGIEVGGTVTDMDLDAWRRVFAVNVDGVMLTARAAIPAILDGGRGGAFLAMSSDAGVLGGRAWAPYAATKHAVIGLVRCLAMDYGRHGIRSNAVAPSFVETPMTDRILAGSESARQRYERLVPLGRFSRPEEVARVIAHLVSDEASYTNGHVYMIDGGETAGLVV